MKIRIPHGRRALTGGALALLAMTGVGAIAAASSASTPSHPNVSHNKIAPSDTDNIQQGDQSGPDTGTAATEAKDSGPDTDNVNDQQGDQSGPDTETAGSDSGK